MQSDGGTDVADVVGGVGVDGSGGDVFVPEIVAGEGEEAVETGALAHGHLRAVGGLLRAVDGEILRRRGAAAGIGILHGDGEGAGGSGVARGGEFHTGDDGGGKRGGAEHNLSAGDKAGAGYGQREIAEIGGGGGYAGEDRRGIEERDGADAGFRGIGGADGFDGDGIGIGESGGRG